ncbi:hypothetical protein Hanom_Chr17g01576651 [Helianthus anomalus]
MVMHQGIEADMYLRGFSEGLKTRVDHVCLRYQHPLTIFNYCQGL